MPPCTRAAQEKTRFLNHKVFVLKYILEAVGSKFKFGGSLVTIKDSLNLLSEGEALVFADIKSRATLWKWRRRGLPAIKVGRRLYFERLSLIDYFVKNGRRISAK